MPAVKRKAATATQAKPKVETDKPRVADAKPDLRDVKEMAREHAAAAVARLVHWMQSSDARMSIAACNALLDRGFGKTSQSGETNAQLGIRHEDALGLLD